MFRNVKIRNVLIIYWSKLLIFFGYWKSTKPIPEGSYCYTPKDENSVSDFMKTGIYKITPCKYYKIISKRYRGCSYMGFITNDPVFVDQCKECGEKS